MEFNTEQLRAVEYCTDIKRRVVAVTGQAGTGKTTIIQKAYEALRIKGRTPILAAPTGRAARRIFEATGIPARTIHKLLEYGKPDIDESTGEPKETTSPGRDRDKPLDYSDVIVDEYMMVNEELHRNLLDALKPGARLIAFGDVSQLPPIEEYEIKTVNGAPFERILQLPSSVVLTSVYRQSEESGILENARRIREGKAPHKRPDFSIEVSEYPIKALRDHMVWAKQNGIDYSSLENQVISPARKGKLGVHALNTVLQAMFYPNQSDGMALPREKWMEQYPATVGVGEKVICNENIYDLRDFFDRFAQWKDDSEPVWTSFIPVPDNFMMLNGEIGIVTDILPDGSIDIDFVDRVVHVPANFRDYIPRYDRIINRDPRKKLDLAYAVTTHKMQGSECRNVCYLVHSTITYMVNRNNIYTAVTRAKERVHYITDSRCLVNGQKLTAQQKAKNMELAKHGGWKIGS